jgi:cell division protein FtsL
MTMSHAGEKTVENSSSSKWMYISFVLIVALILNGSFFVYTYFSVQTQFSTLQTSLDAQEQQLQDLQQ